MQKKLLDPPNAWHFHKMKTHSGGYCGALIECRRCYAACKIYWNSKSSREDFAELERSRLKLREFLGYGTRGRPRAPIQ